MTRAERWTLIATILGSSIVFLDSTVVNVALKAIGSSLPATIVGVLEGQAYVTSGYLATLAALLVLAGALGDYYGRRRVFAIGLAGFGLTSLLCGLAPSLELLALFRVLQGATGALLVPGSLAIITATFHGQERGRAFGIWAAATSATTLFGPIVGGVLVDVVSWRAAFLINAPLVAVALYATVRFVAESRDESASGRFDWLGALVGAVAVGGLAFGAIRGEEKQWADTLAFAALVAGIVALIAFVPLMAIRRNPLVPLGLFRSRGFSVINLSTLLIYGALYTSFWLQSLFLQGALGYSALAAGVVGVPTSILLTLFSTRVGAIAGRVGARRFLTIGPLLMAAGLAWLARIPASSARWDARLADPASLVPPLSVAIDVLPAVVVFGIGLTLVVAPLTTALMSSVPVQNAGLGSAINNAISRIGQPILAALIFIVVTGTFYNTLAAQIPGLDPTSAELRRDVAPLNPPATSAPENVRAVAREASTDAYHLAVLVGAVLLVAGAVVNYVGLGESAEHAPGEPERAALPGPPGG
jgi:EmrB/QacA subfamily drug resistance transporter